METLKGVFPKPKVPPSKNFIKENKKKLRDLQKTNVIPQKVPTKNTKILKTSEIQNQNNVRRPINHRNQCASTSSKSVGCESTVSKNGGSLPDERITSASSTSTCRDMSSQTTDLNDTYFLKDVIIRMPSASILNEIKNRAKNDDDVPSTSTMPEVLKNGTEEHDISDEHKQNRISKGAIPKIHQSETFDLLTHYDTQRATQIDKLSQFYENNYIEKSQPSKDSNHSDECRNLVEECLRRKPLMKANFSRDNVGDLIGSSSSFNRQRTSTQNAEPNLLLTQSSRKFPDIPESYDYGKLPKYLKDMKKENLAKLKEESEIDPNCPPGHIALTEEERKDGLELAQKKYDEVIRDLNRLPISVQSMRTLQRKKDYEIELDKLDKTIQTFSRQKVYMKID